MQTKSGLTRYESGSKMLKTYMLLSIAGNVCRPVLSYAISQSLDIGITMYPSCFDDSCKVRIWFRHRCDFQPRGGVHQFGKHGKYCVDLRNRSAGLSAKRQIIISQVYPYKQLSLYAWRLNFAAYRRLWHMLRAVVVAEKAWREHSCFIQRQEIKSNFSSVLNNVI